MYIWRVKKLAEKFRAGTVTDRQQLPYLLVFVGLSYLASDPYINGWVAYDTLNNFDLLMLPMALIIGLGGTIWCYSTSWRVESEAGFIARYICLGIPILVQIIVAIFALMLAVFLISDYIITIPVVDQFLEAEETGVVDVVMVPLIESIYFWRLRHALRISYTNA